MSLNVPGYWRKNIRNLEYIISGSECYIDVVSGQDQYMIYLSDIPWGSKDYSDRRLLMYRLTKTSLDTLKDAGPIVIDDFWEAMTIAAMLTVFGLEVHLSASVRYSHDEQFGTEITDVVNGKRRKRTVGVYELFSSRLEDHVVFYENEDEDIEDITGGDFIGEQAPIRSRRIKQEGKMSVEEFLD